MQQGSLIRSARKRGPDVWQFRWADRGPYGKRIYRKRVIGTLSLGSSSRNLDANKRRTAQEPMPSWSLFVPELGWSLLCKCLKRNGGDDETRTRDLCRDINCTARMATKTALLDPK